MNKHIVKHLTLRIDSLLTVFSVIAEFDSTIVFLFD